MGAFNILNKICTEEIDSFLFASNEADNHLEGFEWNGEEIKASCDAEYFGMISVHTSMMISEKKHGQVSSFHIKNIEYCISIGRDLATDRTYLFGDAVEIASVNGIKNKVFAHMEVKGMHIQDNEEWADFISQLASI